MRKRNLVKVDGTDLPLEILGTLGCGFQTGAGAVMRSMACPAGSSLVVFGGGPVGLAAVMAGRIRECATIILLEPFAARREIARELGATHIIDTGTGEVAAAIRRILPSGTDHVLGTSRDGDAIAVARASLAPHGMLELAGVPGAADAALTINIVEFITFVHRINGIIEGDSDQQAFIPELLAHHRAGRSLSSAWYTRSRSTGSTTPWRRKCAASASRRC